jgi:hypothetical protein
VFAALLGMLAMTGAITGFSGAAASTDRDRPASTAIPDVFPATITVNASGKIIGGTNSHYIGLSFESGTLNSGKFDDIGDLAQLLRNLGSSVMRFGGNSVDQSYTGISATALAGLVRLARASGWTVLYSEDLGHYNAAVVKADAKSVAAALGTHLSAIACGNEPDLYHENGLRPATYSEADYLKEATACLADIRAGAPNVPLEGADLAGSPDWLAAYATRESGQLAWVGQHYYPMGCATKYTGQTATQVDAKLLSRSLASAETSFFKAAAADAKTAKAPLRISETNSICGGGLAGVSDSYATALWVVDYLLTGAENGVDGFNFHGALNSECTGYTPLCQVGTADEYSAQPIYYGMLFTHLLGSGHLVPVTVHTRAMSDYVTAFALKPLTGGGLRLLVENLTNSHTNITLTGVGKPSHASVLHLTGPSSGPTGTSGVRIQGASVAANGTFKPGAPTTITCSSGSCPLSLNPDTAVLVTIP